VIDTLPQNGINAFNDSGLTGLVEAVKNVAASALVRHDTVPYYAVAVATCDPDNEQEVPFLVSTWLDEIPPSAVVECLSALAEVYQACALVVVVPYVEEDDDVSLAVFGEDQRTLYEWRNGSSRDWCLVYQGAKRPGASYIPILSSHLM